MMMTRTIQWIFHLQTPTHPTSSSYPTRRPPIPTNFPPPTATPTCPPTPPSQPPRRAPAHPPDPSSSPGRDRSGTVIGRPVWDPQPALGHPMRNAHNSHPVAGPAQVRLVLVLLVPDLVLLLLLLLPERGGQGTASSHPTRPPHPLISLVPKRKQKTTVILITTSTWIAQRTISLSA
ncbi:hypothetical protein CPB84DRAFT_1064023 [Gymnopilus junonius]|uniref:Uncharacterized protein n=1 Tax=Gymnopilus junonius TaxID=109634 RepID=A0A9P5TSM2_GYMJU|nr:hypothetical protein CPB84DRAFT_1064023 [Gymnopilus junonius]